MRLGFCGLDVRLGLLAVALVFGCSAAVVAGQAVPAGLKPMVQANRVAASADLGPQTRLTGHLPQWVVAGVPSASSQVELSAPLRVSVVLRRDAAVQAAFTQYLADQQNRGSAVYHQWLTPQQVGLLFGPTESDVAAVSTWLASQGLTVESVSPSRMMLEATGTTAAVGSAFRTSFGFFDLNGTARLSAVAEPSVPTALTALIDSIHGLTDVPVTPMSLRSGPQRRSAGGATSGLSPELTVTSNGVTSHLITPNDFATIFDINSVYSGGNKGATIGSKAQHIAIIGRSRVAASDIAEYAANVGISGYSVNTVIPTTGVDPGAVCTFANARTCATGGDQSEQTLDVSRVIGTAPGVQADLVVSGKLNGADGVDIGVAYNVNTLVDPVMTISYSSCEALSGSAGVTFWDTLFSAGAAEGISTFVSSGDSGVSGCAPAGSATGTVYPASINAICASSYVTCVGGTALYDYVSNSPYWSATNGGGLESALSYIPEVAWNEPGSIGPYQIAASGGGPSLFIGKPSWQSGTGVPPDGHRDTPDVSFPSAGHDAYYVCLDFALGAYVSQGVTVADTCANGYFFSFFGTSAAAPAMASVAALLNTRVGIVQGNLDSLLYRLASAAAGTSVFHDTTIPASLLGCVVINASSCNNSTPGRDTTYTTDLGGVQGYLLTTGYDEVTGLGSIDVGNLLSAAAASAPSFVLAPVYSGLTLISGTSSGNTDTITVASVNGFAGSVNLTCSVTTVSGTAAGSCSMLPAAVTLSNSSSLATLTIATVFGTSGTLSVTVMGTSGTLSASSAVISVTLQAVAINLSTPAALNDSGATTGNVTQMILTSVNGFSGPVTLACTISTGTESFPPTCVFDPPSLSLAANGLNSVAISFGSTKVQVKSGGPQQAGFGWLGMGVSALVYAWMLCLPRFRRRQGLGSLLAFALLAVGLPVVYGCGGGSGSSVGGTVHGSSAGIYVVSVTAQGTTPGGATVAASTSFPLTIQ